jgi:hypothetical protein
MTAPQPSTSLSAGTLLTDQALLYHRSVPLAVRSEVMSRRMAGSFIRDWQEISDQVRRMIFRDTRYQTIRKKQERPAL